MVPRFLPLLFLLLLLPDAKALLLPMVVPDAGAPGRGHLGTLRPMSRRGNG